MKKLPCILLIFSTLVINGFLMQAQNQWTQKASLTAYSGRIGATGFSIGHYGFIGTGVTSTGNVNDFWKWNQKSNTWTAIANYPGIGRIGLTSFSIAGKGYSCLGETGSTNATDLWAYDTVTNAWTPKASFPGVGRKFAFVFVIGTKAYVGCGEPGGTPYYEDVWAYDAVGDTWTQVANFPGSGRAGMCYFALNGYGYTGCGTDGSNGHNDMWKYDPIANTWTSVASFPIQGGLDADPISFAIDDSLGYVGAGTNILGKYYRDFWSYNAAKNTWTPIAILSGVSRSLGVGFSIDNEGYVGMGSDSLGDYLSDFWQYKSIFTNGVNVIKNSEVKLNVYPNPTSGIVNFTYANLSTQNSEVVIIDVLGRTISENTLIGNQGKISIDEGRLNSGVYFYSINSDGSSVASGKFVIEK